MKSSTQSQPGTTPPTPAGRSPAACFAVSSSTSSSVILLGATCEVRAVLQIKMGPTESRPRGRCKKRCPPVFSQEARIPAMEALFQSLLLLIARSTNRQLARQVQNLKAENQILRGKLPASISVI